MKPTILHIEVSGPTGSGKSWVLARIRAAFEADGYTVASPELTEEMRISRPSDLYKPPKKLTVVVISETNEP